MKTSHAIIIATAVIASSVVVKAGLETGTYINDLVTSNPTAADPAAQGDDHLRLVKSVLKNTFPGATKAYRFPTTATKTTNYVVAATDMNTILQMDTTSGALTLTLPTLAAGDSGFRLSMQKASLSANCVFVVAASGAVVSGELTSVTRARRCIPYREVFMLWNGSFWHVSRVNNLPLGAIIDAGVAAPVGYEYAYGQTLASASTDYNEYYLANGNSGVVPDLRGRSAYGDDNMGGSTAGRISVAGGNFDGTVLLATGGAQNHTITVGEMPAHAHPGSTVAITDTHTHTQNANTLTSTGGNTGQAGADFARSASAQTTSGTTGGAITAAPTIASQGGGGAMTVLSPAIITSKLVVVE